MTILDPLRLSVVAGLMLTWGSMGLAQSKPLTVVEFFTSQGCSSCPPANANLITLSSRPDILALSFSVTYWDRLGWKDIFGKPEFTERQYVYEPALGQAGPFTPQMVVNGKADVVGNRLEAIEAVIAKSPATDEIPISFSKGQVAIGKGDAGGKTADIWLVRYDPRTVEVPVRLGENAGRTLPHANVVHELTRLGGWTGTDVSFVVPPGPAGLLSAILVQQPSGGPILAAAHD